MSITVTSNTETGELIVTKPGDLAKTESKQEGKSASTAKAEDENEENSEALNEESDEVEGENAEESEDENEEDEEKTKDDERKPKKGFKNRVQKLRSKISAKDQEISYWKEQAMKSSAPSKETQKEDATKEGSNSGKPESKNYESWEDYVEALADWKLDQKETARTAKERETQAKSEYEKQMADHEARAKEYAKATPGYHERVSEFLEDYGTNGDYQFAPALQRTFIKEGGPALMDALLKSPEELVRINGLPYEDALHELWKVKASLEKSSESSQTETIKKQTKAPPPVKPVGSSKASVKKSIYDPGLSFKEYEQLRAEQLKNK